MSSFFDKITKAVGDITKKVEDSGVIDDLKDLVSGDDSPSMSTAHEVSTTADEAVTAVEPSGSGGPRGWEGAVARAGLDPMSLLTPAELGAMIDLPLDHSYEQFEDEWFGVTWTTRANGGPYVEARFTHGYTDGSPVDVPGVWQYVTGEVGANQPVAVVGAEATADDLDTVYVNAGRSVFYVVSGSLPEGRATRDLHIAVATAVVSKLS